MYNFIKIQFEMGKIDEAKLRSFSPKWITAAQVEEILGGE